MVSIRLVMNGGIIGRAEKGTKAYSEAEIGEQLKIVYAEYQMSQYSGTPMTTQDIQAKLREIYGNDTTASLENGKLTATIKGTTYEYDIATGKTQAGGNSTPTTNAAYAVGDVVTLGGEDFYVIEASDASEATVKLLAKYNVKTESGEGQYTQTASANTLAFDDDSNDYATSQIKTHVDLYKTALEGRMGKATQEVRIMTKEEVEALGGNSSEHSTSGCPAFINEQNYWLGSPVVEDRVWGVGGVDSGLYNDGDVYYDGFYGLRPVVIVLKSNI